MNTKLLAPSAAHWSIASRHSAVVSSSSASRRAVVAVPAGAAAAVRHVEVDLAETAERLAAQRGIAREAVEDAEVGRLVDVHPERQLRDPHAGGLRRAQRVVEEPRAAHGRGGEQLREGRGAGDPRSPGRRR